MKKFVFYLVLCLVITLAAGLTFPGCTQEGTGEKDTREESTKEEDKAKKIEDKDDKNYKQEDEEKSDEKKKEEIYIDYEKVKPNELGEFMILMYHDIGDEDGDWKTSRENFREDMERLYKKDYRLVDLMDMVNGQIDIPAGTTPVVLTFDDGHSGQFNLIEKNGEKIVDPDSAAGILLDLKEKYKDFTLAGNFYINYYPEPFGAREELAKNLEVLSNKGFDVGNHGYAHERLDKMDSPDQIQQELGKLQKIVKENFDGYKLESLALAYGRWPKKEEYHEYVYSGKYNNTSYEHKAVLNVAWSPEISPFHKNFDPLDLERIRANDEIEQEMDRWIKYFENNPEKRYISDGDPETIAIPEAKEKSISEKVKQDYKIIAY